MNRSPAIVEAVEPRRLLSVSLTGSTLRVYGGAGADEIAFALQKGDPRTLRVSLNGTVTKFRAGDVVNVIIGAADGHDLVHTGGLSFKTKIDAGAGDDTVIGGASMDRVTAGPGDDSVVGASGIDVIDAGDGDDVVHAGRGNDTVNAGNGADLVYGNAGDDLISGMLGNNTVYGNEGVDVIYGDLGEDLLAGGAGNDLIQANGGNDRVFGEAGDDFVGGGDGDDLIYGGRDSDEFGSGGAETERRDFNKRQDRVQPTFPSGGISVGGGWSGGGLISGGSSSSGTIFVMRPGAVLDLTPNAIVVDYAAGSPFAGGSLHAPGVNPKP
jgi:Ca2+-binding RTX toxin-like protein